MYAICLKTMPGCLLCTGIIIKLEYYQDSIEIHGVAILTECVKSNAERW